MFMFGLLFTYCWSHFHIMDVNSGSGFNNIFALVVTFQLFFMFSLIFMEHLDFCVCPQNKKAKQNMKTRPKHVIRARTRKWDYNMKMRTIYNQRVHRADSRIHLQWCQESHSINVLKWLSTKVE